MQGKTVELAVGLFLILGLGALFILTFRIASPDGAPLGAVYSVTASFDNIGGLKPGAAVTLSGIRIGRVREIKVRRETYEAQTRIDIESAYDNIPSDSSARILTAGLLGEQYLSLEPGGAETWLRDGDQISWTQSALVLENLVGQLVMSTASATPDADR